jgi:uncharacterized membrane protein HdeD (DUF308 family)
MMASTDLEPLVRNWWMIAARGLLAVLFGSALAVSRIPVANPVVLFGVYATVDGILAIVSALRTARPRMTGWPIVLEGIVSVGFGALVLGPLGVPPSVLVLLAAWGVLTGFFEIVAAVCIPRDVAAHWLLLGGGASSMLLAVIMLGMSEATSRRVALILGIYAIVFGVLMLRAALRFRWADRLEARAASRTRAPDRRARASRARV